MMMVMLLSSCSYGWSSNASRLWNFNMECFYYDPSQRYGCNLLRYLVCSGSFLAVILRREQCFCQSNCLRSDPRWQIYYTDYTHHVYYFISSSSVGELFGRSQGQLGWRLQCCILAIVWGCGWASQAPFHCNMMYVQVPLTCWESNAFDAQAVGPRTNWWATFTAMKALDGERLPLIALGSSCHNQWN